MDVKEDVTLAQDSVGILVYGDGCLNGFDVSNRPTRGRSRADNVFTPGSNVDTPRVIDNT